MRLRTVDLGESHDRLFLSQQLGGFFILGIELLTVIAPWRKELDQQVFMLFDCRVIVVGVELFDRADIVLVKGAYGKWN